MATFSEIKSYIAGIVSDNSLGEFYSVNMKEFANLTQVINSDTYLFLLDAPLVKSENEFTAGNRVLKSYTLNFYIITYADADLPEEDIDDIYSACEDLSSRFFWYLNIGNATLFNVDKMSTNRVKFVTPNTFAGVGFTLKTVGTACNL